MSYLTKYNILSPCQFDFLTNHSTELAVTSVYEQLLNNLNDNKYTCSIFLDLSKAFDTLDYNILIGKRKNRKNVTIVFNKQNAMHKKWNSNFRV